MNWLRDPANENAVLGICFLMVLAVLGLIA